MLISRIKIPYAMESRIACYCIFLYSIRISLCKSSMHEKKKSNWSNLQIIKLLMVMITNSWCDMMTQCIVQCRFHNKWSLHDHCTLQCMCIHCNEPTVDYSSATQSMPKRDMTGLANGQILDFRFRLESNYYYKPINIAIMYNFQYSNFK